MSHETDKHNESLSRVQIVEVDDALAGDWDSTLSRLPTGSFYHLYGWRRLIEGEFQHPTIYLGARRENDLCGVLPLVLVSSRIFGRILCSLPFLNYAGPCADSPAVAGALADNAILYAARLGADYLELRCAEPLRCALPVSTRKVSMYVPLEADADAVWNAFSRKHRKNVRRAAKNGLSVQSGGAEQLDQFYFVLEHSWHDLGTPLYRKSYFQAVLSAFPEQTRIHVCMHDGTAVAAALTGHFNGVVEGMWAGGLPSARPLQANYVLYWEMIRDACMHGFRRFHLGRSTAESGGEEFKSRWNAEPQQLYWYYYRPRGGPMPALNVDNPRYRLAIAAWRRLPLWVTRRLGPPLARCIP